MSVDIGNLNVEDDVNVGEINIPLITPKRGVDYWTPADQQAVVNEAVNSVNAVVMPQEETRQANETTRQNNEETRQANETTRQNNESTRISNEETRISNESERIENETERQETFSGYEARIEGIEDDVEDLQEDVGDIKDEQLTQNTNISSNSTAIASLQTNKANKSETYTKTEVDTALSGKQAVISNSNKLASDLVSDSNQTNKFTTTGEKSTWNAKYDKPDDGIPKTDLSSSVQASLDKADTAIQDISGKVDKVVGKGLSTEDYKTEEKTKLAGIEAEATKTIVDDELSSSSENPVQNKVINASQEEQNDRIENLEQDVEDLRKASVTVKGSGTDLTLENTAKARLIEVELNANTEQKQLKGKNLIDITTLVTGYINTDGSLIGGSSKGEMRSGPIKVKPSTNYIFKIIETASEYSNWFGIGEYTSKSTSDFVRRDTMTTSSQNYIQFTTSDTTEYIRASARNLVAATKIQLEEGTESTEYEEFCGGTKSPNMMYPQELQKVKGNVNVEITDGNTEEQNLPITLGDRELNKIDTPKNYLFKNIENSKYYNSELTANKWYFHEELGSIVYNGTEEFAIANTNKKRYPIRTSDITNMKKTSYTNISGIRSNMFLPSTSDETNSSYSNRYTFRRRGGYAQFYMMIPKDFFTSTTANEILAEFKAYLVTKYQNGTPLKFYYELENYTNTEITDTTLISQLENLFYKSQSYDGQTVISTSSTELAPIIDVEALSQNHDYDTVENVIELEEASLNLINENVKSVNHRGYNSIAPENTLPAFRLSRKKGFNFVETDLCYTSDSVPVLLHDSTINRTARNSDGTSISSTINIGDITYEQALEYDFGIYKGQEYAGTKIPTFEQFIALCKKIGLKPYVELKEGTQEQINSLVNTAQKYGMLDNITWISFYSSHLERVSNAYSKARLGFVVNNITTDKINAAIALQNNDNEVFIDCSVSGQNYINLTDETLNTLIANNLALEIWTVDKNDILNAKSYVSGFTSNTEIASYDLYKANIESEAE